VDAALEMPGLQLAPGQSATQAFQIYAGPKYYSRLDHLGHQEQELMDFGKFKIVSITLLFLMNTFKGWLGNYGLAIIVLTLLVKTILFPLQNKANKSMKRMAILGPKMAELKEKYKDDQTRQSAETMKLYKEYGINPLGGCLPMVVQMPIFFGFLYMLYTAAELRNASFLWVHDLSQPDTVAHLLGFSINILPILMIGSQFWQMSLTPRTGDPSQQKMMMFMPLVFGFFCYNFAAALALYYTMQGVLTIGQLYLTRNQPMPVLAKKSKPPNDPGARGGFPGFGKTPGGGPKRLKP
jgi:YidC/Oxa1 family membrane protein insertase